LVGAARRFLTKKNPSRIAQHQRRGCRDNSHHGKNFTPEEVSAEVLKKLKRDAEAALGEPVTRAVITVPAYFQ